MSFNRKIKELSQRASGLIDHLQTEEAISYAFHSDIETVAW